MFDVHKMKYSLSKKKMEVYNGVTLYLYNGVFVKIRFVLVGFLYYNLHIQVWGNEVF